MEVEVERGREGGAHRYAREERLVMAMGSMLVMKLKLRELWREGGRERGRERAREGGEGGIRV